MSVPSVETRLHILRTQLDALRAVAHVIDLPVPVPLPACLTPGESQRGFARWAALVADSLDEQVRALCAALPADVAKLEAPLGGGR